MKKDNPLFAMPSSKPRAEGLIICCIMLGAADSSVSPAHTGMSRDPLNN